MGWTGTQLFKQKVHFSRSELQVVFTCWYRVTSTLTMLVPLFFIVVVSISNLVLIYRHSVTLTPPWSCRKRVKIKVAKHLQTGISICSTSRCPHMSDVSVSVYKSHCQQHLLLSFFCLVVTWADQQHLQPSFTLLHSWESGQILNTVTDKK